MKKDLGSLSTHRAYKGLPPKEGKRVPFECSPKKVFEKQVKALAARLKAIGCKRVVLGVSGGLDSTLTLLAAAYAFDRAGWDTRGLVGITMPGMGTGTARVFF